MTDTLFATDASATAHNDEAVIVEVGGAEYALPPSTARAFVDDLAAAVDAVGESTADTDPAPEQAAEEFLERVDADTPAPREPDPDAESVMGPRDDGVEQIQIEYGCSECDFESETEAGVRRHQGMVHDSAGQVIAASGDDDEDGDGARPLEDRIVEILDEHDELPSSEIKLLLETSSSRFYNALSTLREAGRVESRKDPADKRRTLYRLAADEAESTAEDAEGDDDDRGGDEDDADDESGEWYPRECRCGVTLHGSFEHAIHRTEEHDSPQSTLDYLEPGEFERTVEAADSPQDVADALDWGVERVLRALRIYGLDGLLADSNRSLSDINNFEFDGVAEQETVADGGAAAVAETDEAPTPENEERREWTPGEDLDADPDASGPRRTCQNCGTSISAQYVKVNEPDGVEQPRCCPNCEDLIRDGNGVREKRT